MQDRLFFGLSRLADRSLIWMVAALLLALKGGRFGKRGAIRGVGAIAATSLIANQPAKRLARRRRPVLSATPAVLARMHLPSSYSFPSGHTASAAAFATAVSMEVPIMSAPAFLLATAVGYSRVYTGVHYPGDVVAGAGLGVAVAVATRRWWPLVSHQPARGRPAALPLDNRPSPRGDGLCIVVNPAAGSSGGTDPIDRLRDALPEAEIVVASESDDFEALLNKAAGSAFALGVWGGDGSVNSAAPVAVKHDRALLVLPGGTLNHLARDLGIRSIEDSVAAIQKGRIVAMDMGLLDGKPFLNTASFGSYPEMVEIRERLQTKIGKWPAMCVAVVRVLRRSGPVSVAINGRPRKLWMIFVGNCRYFPMGFAPNFRERLDDGQLDVRLIAADKSWARTRLLLAVLTGTLDRSRVWEEFLCETLDVESKQGPLKLARDGEGFDGPIRFKISKSKNSLPVYKPE